MKKIFVLFICLLLTGCSFIKDDSVKIVVASDLHYLADNLYDDGDAFVDYVTNDDGKASLYINEIVDSFIEEMLKLKPEIVVLTGDISFEGEKLSHEELAEKLSKLTDNGIKVALIPGNHDLNNNDAKGYSGDTKYAVESVTIDEFKKIYKDMGYGNAQSYDEDSLSYLMEIDEKNWALMVDVNGSKDSLSISSSTYDWIKSILKKAQNNDINVFAFMHQNLLDHNVDSEQYKIKDSDDEFYYLLKDYGVKALFSGHSHMQHYIDLYGVKEITSSSLATYPCQYGIVKINDKGIVYNTKPLELKHSREIKDIFINTITKQQGSKLSNQELSSYYADLLINFYLGTMDKVEYNEEILKGIENFNMSLYLDIKSMLDEIGNNYNTIVIE